MNQVFDVYLARSVSLGEPHARLTLPAYPYALRDALDKVRPRADDKLYMEIETYHRCGILHLFPIELNDLQELNTLAEKLAELNDQELRKFEGLVMMEKQQTDHPHDMPFTLERLYDLAASVDAATLINADTDAELGKFYVTNGYILELNDLPKLALDMLDYDKIGYIRRTVEGGVFLDGGHSYVVRTGELKQEFASVPMEPQEPDYTVLMEVWVPNDPEPRLVSFPAAIPEIDAALDHSQPQSWRCVDCRVPALMGALTEAAALDEVDSAAREIAELDNRALLTYKALLEARGFHTLGEALELVESLDEYLLSPEFTSPTEIAEGNFRVALDEREVETLRPFVNMHAYGQKLLEQQNTVLTEYGAFERQDGQPIQEQTEESAQSQGGMEMEGF